MSKTHGLIPISKPDRSLPLRNPYPSLHINPSTIPKRPPIILIVKFHSIGATFTRNFVNGSFSKVDPLLPEFPTGTENSRDESRDSEEYCEEQRGTLVTNLLACSAGRDGRRSRDYFHLDGGGLSGAVDSLWWRRNRWTGRGTNPLDTRMERGETRRSQSGGEGTRKVGEKTSGGGSVIG